MVNTNKHHKTSMKWAVSLVLSTHISSCSLTGQTTVMNLVETPFIRPLKWAMHSKSWKPFWLWMSSWLTPTIILFHIIQMFLTTKWVLLSSNKNDLLCFDLINCLSCNRIILPWSKRSPPLSWSSKSSTPCSLVMCYADKNLTIAILRCCHILCWNLYVEEYVPNILYHPRKKNHIANTFS